MRRRVVGKFPFTAEAVDELSFGVGDVIQVLEETPDGWATGTCKERSGMFPLLYTEPQIVAKAIALHPYTAQEDEELTFKKGDLIDIIADMEDEDWWLGQIGEARGTFPFNYVKVLANLNDEPPPPLPARHSNKKGEPGQEPRGTAAAAVTRSPASAGSSTPSSPRPSPSSSSPSPTTPPSTSSSTTVVASTKGNSPQAAPSSPAGSGGGPVSPRPNTAATKAGPPRQETFAKAVHTFVAENSDELSFEKDSIVLVTDMSGGDWWAGSQNGATGIFPSTYVVLQDDAPQQQAPRSRGTASDKALSSGRRERSASSGVPPPMRTRTVTALHTFEAEADDELSFKAGDVIVVVDMPPGPWWMGELEGRRGLFPPSYTNAPSMSGGTTGHPKKVIALFNCAATDAEDLPLKEGDVITVVDDTNALWWIGEKDGKRGVFPANYVDVCVSFHEVVVGIKRARALSSYTAVSANQLSFQEGDTVVVIDNYSSKGWWFGECHGRGGWFPARFVSMVVPKKKTRWVVAVADYVPDTEAGGLAFCQGDVFVVTDDADPESWFGDLRGTRGWFPSACVRDHEGEPVVEAGEGEGEGEGQGEGGEASGSAVADSSSQSAGSSPIKKELTLPEPMSRVDSAKYQRAEGPLFPQGFVEVVDDLVCSHSGLPLGSILSERSDGRDFLVVVKTLPPTPIDGPSMADEVAKMVKLKNANLVNWLGVCVEDGLAFCEATETSLEVLLLKAGSALPLKLALPIAKDVSKGLAFLHGRTPVIVHMGLRPGVVHVTAGGRAKLADFGPPLPTRDAVPAEAVCYMAPELLDNSKKITKAVDVYSYGVLVNHMLTGEVPFGGETDRDSLLQRITSGERPLMSTEVPADHMLQETITQCWSTDPFQRPLFASLVVRW